MHTYVRTYSDSFEFGTCTGDRDRGDRPVPSIDRARKKILKQCMHACIVSCMHAHALMHEGRSMMLAVLIHLAPAPCIYIRSSFKNGYVYIELVRAPHHFMLCIQTLYVRTYIPFWLPIKHKITDVEFQGTGAARLWVSSATLSCFIGFSSLKDRRQFLLDSLINAAGDKMEIKGLPPGADAHAIVRPKKKRKMLMTWRNNR
jgi:hypothetical protein